MKSICEHCGVEFNYSPSKSRGKYCSNMCNGAHRFLIETVPRVEAGKVSHPATLKRYLKWRRGNKCVTCGNEGRHNCVELILQLDHIDGNSDNNVPENLRLLCPNCHSQTPTFATRQKKDTRRNRYLRKIKGYLPD